MAGPQAWRPGPAPAVQGASPIDTVAPDIRAVEFTPGSNGGGPVLPERPDHIP